ncbi:MAG: hypothetical protein WAZ12_03800 [Candidatus Absconditicoccaceae bacterium]
MKTIKNLLKTILILGFTIGFPTYAANIYINSTYPEARFTPSDKLHAGCDHIANVVVESKGEDISTINLVLKYDTKKIKIIRIVPVDQSNTTNYSIEYGKILFNKINNEDFKDTKTALFNLYYKSDENITENKFEFTDGSYLTTKYGRVISLNKSFVIPFAKAPECQPDVVPPIIDMIKPLNKTNGITLDSSFIFEIKDDGKGIDKKSLKLNINKQEYLYDDNELFWSGDQIIVYPRTRLPVNKVIPISISISDKQKYGGANTHDEQFEVKTATGLILENYLDPFKFRELSKGYENFRGTQKECALIGNIYLQEDGLYQKSGKSILKKLGCAIPAQLQDINEEETIYTPTIQEKVEKKSYISVFAVIGRTLFVITFILKLHYRHSFTKHKKIVEQFKKLSLD